MKTPLFINSWIKLTWWIAYTAAVLTALIIAALYLSSMVWLATPFLFMFGFGIQSYFINKKILLTPSSTNTLQKLVSSPESVNQDAFNLCGPAAMLYALLYTHLNDTEEFIQSFQNNPRTVGLSLPTRCQNIFNSLPIDLSIMMAMKHTFNFTGYHPITRWIEQIQGATLPKQMVDWMHFFEDRLNVPKEQRQVVDTTELRNSHGQPLSLVHRAVLGGVYSQEHYTPLNFHEHLLYLLEWSQSSASVIMLMDINLCRKILGDNSPPVSLSLAGVEFSHYVYLHHIKVNNSDNTVTIKISTWGVCAERTIACDDFEAGFRGFLGWGSVSKANIPIPVSNDAACDIALENIQNNFIPYYTRNQHTFFPTREASNTVSEVLQNETPREMCID